MDSNEKFWLSVCGIAAVVIITVMATGSQMSISKSEIETQQQKIEANKQIEYAKAGLSQKTEINGTVIWVR